MALRNCLLKWTLQTAKMGLIWEGKNGVHPCVSTLFTVQFPLLTTNFHPPWPLSCIALFA